MALSKSLRAHYDTLCSLLRKYNTEYGKNLSFGHDSECKYNDCILYIPLKGASDLRFNPLKSFFCNYYPDVDIEYQTNTEYADELWFIVNISKRSINKSRMNPYDDDDTKTSCSGACVCTCLCFIFIICILFGGILLFELNRKSNVYSSWDNTNTERVFGMKDIEDINDNEINENIGQKVVRSIVQLIRKFDSGSNTNTIEFNMAQTPDSVLNNQNVDKVEI